MSIDIHENRQGQYRAGTISMTVLGAFFVALRFLSRWKKGVSIGWDDYLVLVSLVFLFAVCGLNLAMIDYGMGIHADVLPVENLVMIAKLLMTFECIYCTAVGIVKISILLMYARIFPTREFRIAAYILGFIVISWVIAIICVSVFQCTPVAKAWDTSLPGTCINLKGSFIGNAVPNILTDVAILSLPVRVVWGLQATLVHRLSVIAVFLLGSFVIFTSAYRFSTLFKFEPADVSLDPRRSLHLVSDRDLKRNHFRLHADTAPTVRDAFIEIWKSRRHIKNTNNRWQNIRPTKLRNGWYGPAKLHKRRSGLGAWRRVLVQVTDADAC